jgi:hypothetical protein
MVRRSGTVEAVGGALKIRVPKGRLAALEPAIEILRNGKTEVLSVLASTPEPTVEELTRAGAVLRQAGIRLMRLVGADAVGVWSDLDSPAIRSALRILGSCELPVLYLDGPGVPLRYKLRRVSGEPVPEYVLREMERSPKPWKVRARMLGPAWRFVPWPAAPEAKPHTIDPATGIRPTAEWGASCGRGFVSAARFSKRDPVIPRTNRATTRKWRALDSPQKRSADA